MPIRPATYHDLYPASKALTAAFKDESFHGPFLHPRRHEYPNDMYLYFLRRLRVYYAKTIDNGQLLVSFQTNAEGTEECITGFAYWDRKTAKPRSSLYGRIAIKAAEWYNYAESLIYPNRAVDQAVLNAIEGMGPFIGHHWTGSRTENWYLDLMAVDPSKQKQGYGREMVRWGFDRAREEGVGCSVVSAEGKERFYQACGYDVGCGRVSDYGGEANPVHSVAGGAIFFWDNGIEPVGVKKYGEA